MKNVDQPINFGAGLKELESITAWFESEDVDLDQALGKFERGMTLAAELRAHLQNIENRVEKIKQKFDRPAHAADAAAQEPVSDSRLESFDSAQTAPDLFSS